MLIFCSKNLFLNTDSCLVHKLIVSDNPYIYFVAIIYKLKRMLLLDWKFPSYFCYYLDLSCNYTKVHLSVRKDLDLKVGKIQPVLHLPFLPLYGSVCVSVWVCIYMCRVTPSPFHHFRSLPSPSLFSLLSQDLHINHLQMYARAQTHTSTSTHTELFALRL